jgi:hypothetical protein
LEKVLEWVKKAIVIIVKMMVRECWYFDFENAKLGCTIGRYMSKRRKILAKILAGSKNLDFNEIMSLAEGFGFLLSRVSGSHHIFVHSKTTELVNLQKINGQANPYQVRQFMDLVERYNLKLED